VRPPVFALLARFGTCIASATCPCASVTIAGDEVAQNGPLLGGTDNFGLLPLHRDPPVDRGTLLIR
jgi:hypothetical protein